MSVFADKIMVSTDRQTIEMGDIIELTIKTDFQTYGKQPDFEALKASFELLGKQQSNQIQLINGDFSSTTQWKITLLAKQPGQYTIPSFKIGKAQSSPLTLTVSPAHPKSDNQFGNYTLTSEVNRQAAYVQEEVIYTLRLYFLGSLSGNIRPPIFEEALSITLKEQSIYGKEIQGKPYTVYEWLYAFYPQKSGSLTISGPLFTGIQHYRNHQKRVQEIAPAQEVKVLPVPDAFTQITTTSWLPARTLTLTEAWEQQPTSNTLYRVGDSLTRTLTLTVKGLLSSQLPSFTPLSSTGDIKVYSDKAVTRQTPIENGVQSTLTQKQVIILNKSGEVTLPAQTITWWNTLTDTLEETHLPAHTFKVTAAAKPTTAQSPSETNSNSTLSATEPEFSNSVDSSDSQKPDVSRETSGFWKWVSLTLVILLFITVFIFIRARQKYLSTAHIIKHSSHNKMTESNLSFPVIGTDIITSLCDQVKKNQTLSNQQLYQSLRTVLKEQYQIRSLDQLKFPPLRQAIDAIETVLFSQTKPNEQVQVEVCTAFNLFVAQKKTIQKMNKPHESSSQKLTALYPKK